MRRRGIDELVMRRIGRNELAAIDVCYGVVAAQLEYAAQNGAYAAKVLSDPGKRNGLYWETKQGETHIARRSAARARGGGRLRGRCKGPKPYHGYYYRSLPAASKDDARKGFALVAYPAEYGVSGVMTFLVNQDGVVLQKDLGEDTATRGAFAVRLFASMTRGRQRTPDPTNVPCCGVAARIDNRIDPPNTTSWSLAMRILQPLALIALGLLTACTSKPEIRANTAPAANFSAYKTYTFVTQSGH